MPTAEQILLTRVALDCVDEFARFGTGYAGDCSGDSVRCATHVVLVATAV